VGLNKITDKITDKIMPEVLNTFKIVVGQALRRSDGTTAQSNRIRYVIRRLGTRF
jgi:hypothetical protein